jgi:hypothetical protein
LNGCRTPVAVGFLVDDPLVRIDQPEAARRLERRRGISAVNHGRAVMGARYSGGVGQSSRRRQDDRGRTGRTGRMGGTVRI